MNLPPIAFDDRPCPLKMSFYTPDLLPAAIYVAFEKYVSSLTTPSDSPDLLPTDDHNTLCVLNKYVPLKSRVHRGYYFRKHGQIRCYKNTRF